MKMMLGLCMDVRVDSHSIAGLEVDGLHDAAPARRVLAHGLEQGIRPVANRIHAVSATLLSHFARVDRAGEFGAQFVDDGLRCSSAVRSRRTRRSPPRPSFPPRRISAGRASAASVFSPLVASTLTRPVGSICNALPTVSKYTGTMPPITSWRAGVDPRYGTWTIFSPAERLSISAEEVRRRAGPIRGEARWPGANTASAAPANGASASPPVRQVPVGVEEGRWAWVLVSWVLSA